MYISQGIGLAAPQVGLESSVMIIDIGEGLINFINPDIIESSGRKTSMEEGCLSLPGISVNVKRPEKIKVRAQNEKGEFFIKNYEGLYAKAVQHEVDHLHGRLIIDYLDPVRKFFVQRQLISTGGKRNM
jgi:peptide deformylase